MARSPADQPENWGNFTLLKLSSYGFGMIGFVLAMDIIILPEMVKELAPSEWKNTYLAIITFSGLMMAGLAQPFVGRASDNTRSFLGRRLPYMLWGWAFVSLGLIGVGFAPNYVTLFFVWVFIQANFNVGYGPYQALIRDLVPLSRVGVASSVKILADASGAGVLGAICSSLLGRAAGGPIHLWVWLSLGVIAIAMAISTLITSMTVRAKEAAANVSGQISGLSMSGEPLGIPEEDDNQLRPLHPQLRRFMISRLLIMASITAFPTFGRFFLEESVKVSNPSQALGWMILVVGGALALSIYPAGWASDKIGRKPVVIAAALAGAFSSIWLLWANDVSGLLITSSLLGVSIGTLLSSNWALANELGTQGREALHMGMVNLATTGGSAAAKVMGPGIDLLNRASDGRGWDALLITCSLLFVIGGMILIPLKVVDTTRLSPATSPKQAG